MRHQFEKAQETERLVEFFRSMTLTRSVSFEQISKAVDFHVHSSLSAYQSAKKIAERDHGIVVESIRGFGCTRLTGDKICESGERDITAIRRRASRGAKRQEIAIAQNLDQRHMIRSTELLSRFRIIGDAAAPASTNRSVTEKPAQAERVDVRSRLKSV